MQTQRTDPPRPRRADVAGSYDLGTEVYEALWSPVILPPGSALSPCVPPRPGLGHLHGHAAGRGRPAREVAEGPGGG